MFNKLPLERFFSALIWIVLIFTIVSSFQLIILERLIKKDDPYRSTYSKMTPENKKKIHTQLLKMILGIAMMGLLVVIDKH
jgi:hypothetical protein